MGFVHLSRHIRAAPHDVFAFATDVERLPSWLSLIEEIRSASPRLDEVGAQLCALMQLGPRHLEVDWTVTKVEPDRVLHLEGTSLEGGDASVVFETGLWDGETDFDVDLEYELPGGFVTSVADKVWVERSIAHDLKQSLKSLAAQVSAGA